MFIAIIGIVYPIYLPEYLSDRVKTKIKDKIVDEKNDKTEMKTDDLYLYSILHLNWNICNAGAKRQYT